MIRSCRYSEGLHAAQMVSNSGRLSCLAVPAKPHRYCEGATMLQKSPLYAYIPVKDVGRARQFYEQKLGFRPRREDAGGVVYEFGERTACFMYPTLNAGTSKASQAFWQVDDIEREVADLKARGVTCEEYGLLRM